MTNIEARQESGRLHVSGLLIPWEQPITVGGVEEVWTRGALDRQMEHSESRSHVRLDVLHAAHAPAGHGETLDTFGTLVASEARQSGQWGDFRLDDTGEARMAWVLADDGILDSFSVTFVSIDPPHVSESRARTGTKGQGRIREAILDLTALTNRPAYRAAKATAAVRQRHPILDELDAVGEDDRPQPSTTAKVLPDRLTVNSIRRIQ